MQTPNTQTIQYQLEGQIKWMLWEERELHKAELNQNLPNQEREEQLQKHRQAAALLAEQMLAQGRSMIDLLEFTTHVGLDFQANY